MPKGRWIKKSSPGRSIGKRGYVQIRLINHPFFPGKSFAPEHRVVMAEYLGRKLRKGEEVHHKKQPKSNNRISNLQLMKNRKEHAQEHRHPCSPETRAKISAAKKGKKYPWLVGAALGCKRSKEFKHRVSLALTGRPKSDAHRANLSKAAFRRYRRERGEQS